MIFLGRYGQGQGPKAVLCLFQKKNIDFWIFYMPIIDLGHNWKMTVGLINMGHPTIFEKWYFGVNMVKKWWDSICKVSEGSTTAKMNEISQEKQLLYSHLFPLKGVVNS